MTGTNNIKEKYIVSGNEVVSLPSIRERDGAIECITFLHMGAKGMIQMTGDEDYPFIKPFLSCDGKEYPIENINWERQEYWIPRFEGDVLGAKISGVYLAPIGHRGFGIRLTLEGSPKGKDIAMGLKGNWSDTIHSINEDKPVRAEKNLYKSGWNHSYVMDIRPDISLFAFAPIYTETPENCDIQSEFSKNNDRIEYSIYSKLKSSEKIHEMTIWFGIGFEEVAAATSAKEMLRQGFSEELDKTKKWLGSRIRKTTDPKLDEIMNINMFFSYFYGGGITLDTEDFVLVTSRSPRYYVSAAYWDRDSLIWSFPSILMTDTETARQMLVYVFTKQIRNVGIHSRYIDGTVLEPGFELDELCAPVLALKAYIDSTGDKNILDKNCISDGIDKILNILSSKRHPDIALYETFLQPTDDIRVYPYLTYDNVLVWKILNILNESFIERWPSRKTEELLNEADAVKKSIYEHCVKEKDGKQMFAWSVDLQGGWDIYDEPPGSLLLLPHYGFCEEEDPIWKHTVSVIRREDYPYSFADRPIAEIGCPHAPHPWVLSIANSLLSDRKEQAKKHLLLCKMDNLIACESVDEYTGESATGDAFATCAGFLAYAIYKAFGKY